MKKLLAVLMLSPLTSFASYLDYQAMFEITYKNGGITGTVFTDYYNTVIGFKESCEKDSRKAKMQFAFEILDHKTEIDKIIITCVDEDFNVEKIDLTKKILDKVK
jgi:hypothetical protein